MSGNDKGCAPSAGSMKIVMPDHNNREATLRRSTRHRRALSSLLAFAVACGLALAADSPRERVSINDHWRFAKGDPTNSTPVLYDVRPDVRDRRDEQGGEPPFQQILRRGEVRFPPSVGAAEQPRPRPLVA